MVTVQNIFDKNFGNRSYGGGTRAGEAWVGPIPDQSEGWAQPSPSRPCPAPIRSILKKIIKNILHSHNFPGHSISLMTLVLNFFHQFFQKIMAMQISSHKTLKNCEMPHCALHLLQIMRFIFKVHLVEIIHYMI